MKRLSFILQIITSMIAGILLYIWLEKPNRVQMEQCPPCIFENDTKVILESLQNSIRIIFETKFLHNLRNTEERQNARFLLSSIYAMIIQADSTSTKCLNKVLNTNQRYQIINIFQTNPGLRTGVLGTADILAIIAEYRKIPEISAQMDKCNITYILYLIAFASLFPRLESMTLLDLNGLTDCLQTVTPDEWKNFFSENLSSGSPKLPGCVSMFMQNFQLRSD